ncbi:MAG: preprotein translocase subunit SecG [Planctomycetaceae bacterium]|nr:preprotein translocase subunit SecG [Planctomycetaceae bacterium]
MLVFLLGSLLLFTSVIMILLVLIQRGRGGGLAGAFGGMGGQSALGVRAGDVFTKITVVIAILWVLLAGILGIAMRSEARAEQRGEGLEGGEVFAAEEEEGDEGDNGEDAGDGENVPLVEPNEDDPQPTDETAGGDSPSEEPEAGATPGSGEDTSAEGTDTPEGESTDGAESPAESGAGEPTGEGTGSEAAPEPEGTSSEDN